MAIVVRATSKGTTAGTLRGHFPGPLAPVVLSWGNFWHVHRPFRGRKRSHDDRKRCLDYWIFLLVFRVRSEALRFRGSKALYGSLQGLQATPLKPFLSTLGFNWP